MGVPKQRQLNGRYSDISHHMSPQIHGPSVTTCPQSMFGLYLSQWFPNTDNTPALGKRTTV